MTISLDPAQAFPIPRRLLTACTLLFAASIHGFVQAESVAMPLNPDVTKNNPIQIQVWPKLAPGETTANPGHLGDTSGNVARITDVTAAQLFVYPAAKAMPGPAVMVCPGGSYSILASDLEGSEIAKWLNGLGYTAAVLYYRVPNKRDGAAQDGQRALSLLRARAKEFGIDSKQLGIIGFSAGGHLSARLAVHGNDRSYLPIDDVDQQSCRPDFAMLIYPAYLVNKDTGTIAPEVQPVAGMPPMFLAQTKDDPLLCVPQYAKALAKVGVAVRSHVYDKGGHGYGLRAKPDVPAYKWSADAARWLEKNFPVTAATTK